MSVNTKLLQTLVCPITKTGLRYDASNKELISDRARLAYPIHNGMPVMVAEKARPLDDHEVKK